MLKIENLCFRYRKKSELVLNGVSLEIAEGEVALLLGKNGSGKTTLFNNILGILKPESGSIFFDGEELTQMSRRERAKRIAYVPQDIRFGSLWFTTHTHGQNLHFGLRAGQRDYELVDEIIEELIWNLWHSETQTNSPAAKAEDCHSGRCRNLVCLCLMSRPGIWI